MLIWGLIIAIVLFPLFDRLRKLFWRRNKLTSFLITLVVLSILVLPSIWLVEELVKGIKFLAGFSSEGSLYIPVPHESVKDWPLIGHWLYENWLSASEDLGGSMQDYLPQIVNWSQKLLEKLANTGLGLLHLAASIVIAGIFLVFFEKGSITGKRIFNKMAGERGEEFLEITLSTIHNVATGVLGVALIQTALMGVALILAGVPLAAVWIILILIMTITQIPVLIFNIPLFIYLFAFREPLPAVLWSLLFLVTGMLDNVLKPLFMGKDARVPTLVVFLGALGGFIAFQFIGLFLGAIILSLAYQLYLAWLFNPEEDSKK